MSDKPTYGVLAYISKGGRLPRDEECHFDGWFSDRSWAEATFEDFCKRYPTALVHLVINLKSEWR